jgi:O-antigen ligase
LAALWLAGAISGVVLVEPAPYEFAVVIAMVLYGTIGLTLRRGLVPLLFLMILQNIGYAMALVPVISEPNTVKWTAVSAFLSFTAVFLAALVTDDTERRLAALFKGYILAAVVAALIGILAYFGKMPDSERFLLYGRAASTFKDPNVFGPFLVLPGLLLLQRVVYSRRLGHTLLSALLLMVIAAGLLLSFSRGAWGHFTVSALLTLLFGFIISRSPKERLRIVLLTAIGIAAIALFIAALLSIPAIADLFKERAFLLQDYDAGQTGRFGGHKLGALLALDNPFGIGPIQFSRIFGSEAHNTFVTTFLDGGWLGGAAWIATAGSTLVMGLRYVFVTAPWQRTYIAIYCSFIGEVGESYIIDVHHWRHYYLTMGLVWGLMLAHRRVPRGRPRAITVTRR